MSGMDEEVSDYLDGRLAPEERTAFDARLSRDADLARRVRLTRALKSALAASAPPMPPELKAALKRRARAAGRGSWLAAAREALAISPWPAYGASAAFAAAALVLAVRHSAPRPAPRAAAATGASAAPSYRDGDASAALRELWSDDDGRDGDEG